MRRIALMIAGLALLLSGCGGSKKVEVIDLNKVLDIFLRVMKEKDPSPSTAEATKNPKATKNQKVTNTSAKAEPKAKPKTAANESEIKTVKENKAKQEKILKRFAEELNKAKLVKSHIGVQMAKTGAVEGFTDKNKNNQMDRKDGDKRLFKIQIDAKKNRLVASDEHGYHRDSSYRYRSSGGGFFMGYMFGSMMGRQRSYYPGSRRPTELTKRMSPRTYHRSAVSSVRSRSSGFRSRSGSGGFSFGK